MKKRQSILTGLVAAGLLTGAHAKAADEEPVHESAETGSTLYEVLQATPGVVVAGHRSHSSHSSHRSHGSHRSSSGYYRPSTPVPNASRNIRSTPPSSVLPRSPEIAPQSKRTKVLGYTDLVMRVQMGLKAEDYYTGRIDGVVGTETKAALVRFQSDRKLRVTGSVTPGVLNALDVSTE